MLLISIKSFSLSLKQEDSPSKDSSREMGCVHAGGGGRKTHIPFYREEISVGAKLRDLIWQ